MLGTIDTSASIAQAQSNALAGSAALAAPKLPGGKTVEQVQKSAQDFEAVFATEMLTPMFEGLEVNPTFGGGHGEEMFRTMLLDQYGKQMARNDSLGMVHQITSTLLAIQEGKH